ncbi:MAG TPA: helix-turn-helix domain-containing protein, partial [Vicinamibacteria bacterium]|nr:helix-turn-helix domain-containing protein [Vicinamibacteria bacterium]
AAEQELLSRAWPGNVRQLRNVLERALLLSDHSTLGPEDVADVGSSASPVPAAASGRITLAEAERRHIEAVLREERGAVAAAAEVLGLSRSALYERIKKHGIVAAKGTES